MIPTYPPHMLGKYSARRVYFIHAKTGESYDQNSKKRWFN